MYVVSFLNTYRCGDEQEGMEEVEIPISQTGSSCVELLPLDVGDWVAALEEYDAGFGKQLLEFFDIGGCASYLCNNLLSINQWCLK